MNLSDWCASLMRSCNLNSFAHGAQCRIGNDNLRTMNKLIYTILGLLMTCGSSDSQVVSLGAFELEIGSSNQVTDPVLNQSGSRDYGGAAIGYYNTVSNVLGASLAVGYFNSVNGYFSAAFGEYNSVWAGSSVAIGFINTFSSSNGNAYGSLAVGQYNTVNGPSSFNIVSGYNNAIGGVASINLWATATFGRGLYNSSWHDATIVGHYNAEPLIATPLLFAVGNGSGSAVAQRSNALEVYTDGTVVVRKRQGDILMGEFGN